MLGPAAASIPAHSQLQVLTPDARILYASARTGAGLEALRAAMLFAVGGEAAPQLESATLTNVRQHTAVSNAARAIHAAARAARAKVPHEALLLDLYNALENLDALTGSTTSDDILNLIFATFCIGK